MGDEMRSAHMRMRSKLALVKNAKGFSLIEAAVAMSIAGLLLLGGVLLARSVMEQRLRDEAADYLHEVRRALVGFARENKRLPWADAESDGLDGHEDSGSYGSYIPYRTLGVKPADPWGRQLKYTVGSVNGYANICNSLYPLGFTSSLLLKITEFGPLGNGAFRATAVIVSGGARDADVSGSVFDAVGTVDNSSASSFASSPPSAMFDDLLDYTTKWEILVAMGCPVGSFPVGPNTPDFDPGFFFRTQ